MVSIEIPPNPNCEAVELRLFHELEPPRPIRRVRVAPDGGLPAWHDVVGWTAAGGPCPALARRVDDSGDGVAILVSGGDAGVRLRPAGGGGRWELDGPGQRGAPFLLLADLNDVEWADADG